MTTTTYPGSEPVVAAAVYPDSGLQVRDALHRLFVRRARLALATLLGGTVLFAMADSWADLRAVELETFSVSLIVCGWVLLRRSGILPYAPVISWLIFTVGCVLTAIGGVRSLDAASATPILCVILAFGAGALFPWGALVQVSVAAIAAAAVGLNLYWVHATGHTTISFQGAEGVAVCLICSVICSVGARSRLLAFLHDNVERKHAEEMLRRSNQYLEQRVEARVAELEAAKRALASEVAHTRQDAEALRERETLLRAIIDNSSALIYVKDLDGRYVLTNAQHARVFGYHRDEIAGKTPSDLFPAAVSASLLADDRRVLTANRPLQLEEVVPHDDGPHTYLSIKFAVRDPSGAIYGVCGISTDISERKRMESELRRSQSTLSAVIESSDEAIWALDSAYRIQLLNSVARRRFPQAYGTHAEIGGDFRELLPVDIRPYWSAQFQQALSGQRAVAESSGTRDGETQQFLVSLNPIVEATRVVGVTIFIKDITALKRAEEQVRQHQAALAQVLRRGTMGALAAELAHEINQPLGAIANYAQGCRRRLLSGDVELTELDHAIEQIVSEAERAGDILDRLQSRVLQETARDECIDVSQVVRDALRAVEFRCHGLKMQLAVTQELPQARGDVTQIEQVVLNLLHNAIDALQAVPSEVRRLIVAAHVVEPGAIEVTVGDTGQGLDPAVADRIFQPFVTTKADGLGMGLAISRSIVDAHRGRLWVTSAPGRGCTFHFTLPVAGAA